MSKTITVTLTEEEATRVRDSLLQRAVDVGNMMNAARMDNNPVSKYHARYQKNLMDLYYNKFGEVS